MTEQPYSGRALLTQFLPSRAQDSAFAAELRRRDIDIASLSETRLSGVNQMQRCHQATLSSGLVNRRVSVEME